MTELTDLIGKRRVDAVDFDNEQVKELYGDGYEDCSVCRFRLDGVVYIAIEDPNDGYRSSMRNLIVANDVAMKNVFPSVEVLGKHRTFGDYGATDDVLELVDTITGKVVLEVGTDNSDDYYPSFVASFHPENMATNADIEAAEKKAAEGWIEWKGGERPVPGEALVVIQAEFGPAQEPARADIWAWDSDRPKRDQILAYRVVGATA